MNVLNPTVYVKTSVIGYLTVWPAQNVVVAAYREITQERWSYVHSRFSLVASELVVATGCLGRQPPLSSTTGAMGAAP